MSVRWTQPIQQHGRRMPSFSSEQTRSTCSSRVSGDFTEMAQQIHSLRASGVKVSHFAKALGSDRRALRRSSGRSCATPPEIALGIGQDSSAVHPRRNRHRPTQHRRMRRSPRLTVCRTSLFTITSQSTSRHGRILPCISRFRDANHFTMSLMMRSGLSGPSGI